MQVHASTASKDEVAVNWIDRPEPDDKKTENFEVADGISVKAWKILHSKLLRQ